MHVLATTLLVLAPADATWSARYVVTFVDDPDRGHRAEVEAVIEHAGRGTTPDELEVSMSGGYGEGYGAFVRGPAVFVPEGSRAPKEERSVEVLDDRNGAYRLPLLRDGRTGLRYEVALEHDPDEELGWDETPHAISDGILWTGRSLFIAPDDAEIHVQFVLPAGQHISTSLEPARSAGHFRAPDTRRLRETYFVVGTHFERLLEVESMEVVLAIDGSAAAGAELIEETVMSFLKSAAAATGGPAADRVLVAITVAQGEGGGSVYGRDAHVLMKGPPAAGGETAWKRVLCHELFHLWNARRIGFESREMWFSEGFTDYYAHVLLRRTDSLTAPDLLGTLAGWTQEYLKQDPIGLREAGVLGRKNNTVIYQGGALAAFCLDVAIRDATSNRRSLDDVLKGLYAANEKNAGPVPIAELDDLLKKLGRSGSKDFLEHHVAGDEPLPLEEAFERAGLALESRRVSVPGRMPAIVHLFRCPGMTVVAGGIEVNNTTSSVLMPGDLVVTVAGRAVSDFGDLQQALADRSPGKVVPVSVLRDGEPTELELTLGGHGEDLEATVEDRLNLVPVEEATKRARTIRAALFGELRR